MIKRNKFKSSYLNLLEKETWDKGLPMIYENDKKELVRHWKDGRIEVIANISKSHISNGSVSLLGRILAFIILGILSFWIACSLWISLLN